MTNTILGLFTDEFDKKYIEADSGNISVSLEKENLVDNSRLSSSSGNYPFSRCWGDFGALHLYPVLIERYQVRCIVMRSTPRKLSFLPGDNSANPHG
jgi:hypothetical protein